MIKKENKIEEKKQISIKLSNDLLDCLDDLSKNLGLKRSTTVTFILNKIKKGEIEI